MARIPMMKKVQQVRSLSALWKHRRQLFRMLKDIVCGSYKASFLTTVAVVATIIYIISPIDLLPDIIPFLGWTDDGIVFYFLLKRLMREMDRYDASKRGVISLVKR